MSLIFMDSFDYATSDILYKYSYKSDLATINTGETRRVGAKSLKIQSSGGLSYPGWQSVQYSPPSNLAGVVIGFVFKHTAQLSEGFHYKTLIIKTTGGDISLERLENYSLRLAGGGTTATTDPAIVAVDVFSYIEVGYTKGVSETITLKVNENIVAEIPAVNINVDVTHFQLGSTYGSDAYFQDLYFLDKEGATNNDFLGDVKVDIMRPDSAGTYTDFTPNVDTNYENVDEYDCDEDTTYNESAVVGDKDTYNLSAISLTGQEIFGTQQCSVIRKTDASLRYGKQLLISDTTEDLSDEIQFNDTYTGYQRCFDTDPDTATSWTESGVNALESGLTVTQ